jgi:type II secretion system protein G
LASLRCGVPVWGKSRRRHAFTLVEIMVVVVIVGLLAGIAVPTYLHLVSNAKASRFVSDLRTFAGAFETYALEHGAWPPDANRGIVPSGMSGELVDATWKNRNSLGGQWDWDYRQNGYTAAITTIEVAADDNEMEKIDAMIDDGNLATGNFFKLSNGRYVYLLQK